MADEENKFISKINSGFPDYLDWEKLRAEGIAHLGNLAGEIWTDHNVHDPGITILEMLCYAMMDLGYRTNLPPEDIFARDPNDTTNDSNFFTPAQILVCNPVTITDFRKMLVDIEGVKNAWLEVADDVNSKTYCNSNYNFKEENKKDCCNNQSYNGLYHVYLELKDDYYQENPGKKDQLQIKDDDKYKALIDKIRNVLMSHRNLCEDFIDIHVLCKKKIGLCADIELERDADAETVYKNVVEALRNFFSPSPKFYTLRQMLEEKNKNIEDVFAGRPYNLKESHGFIETDEFDLIKLQKVIRLSDVYSEIFKVAGVRAVRNLGWKSCDGLTNAADPRWEFTLPENHVPDFSPGCSAIKFERNGMTVAYDAKKFASLFEMDFRQNGKISYKTHSPYLDVVIPKGVYHSDLGEYPSIQNEFPRVYGIAEGGLPDDTSDKRKAQALQLKAYLLFFDQLLANYASQLKNIRLLFSAKSSTERHTYFLNQPTDVPDLQKLVRFKANDNGTSMLGETGSRLAIPVSAVELNDFLNRIKNDETICEINFRPYEFCNHNESETAVNIFMQGLLHGNLKPEIKSTKSGCWFFYFLLPKDDIAYAGNKFYSSEKEALEAASSVQYAGTFEKNYRTYITQESKFSFLLELNLINYTDYLQLILEDQYLYRQRREEFLNHLLSRFAEKFTDFALLSFSLLDEHMLERKEAAAKEKFLMHYDDLSANRGRAYDYMLNGWNNENISGFEKRVAALAGIADWKKHYLCNFVVEEKEEQYFIVLKFSNELLFADGSKYFSRENAEIAAEGFLNALKKKENYEIIKEHDHSWRIKINHNEQHLFYKRNIEERQEAEDVRQGIQFLFSKEPSEKDVHVSQTDSKIIICDYSDQEVSCSKEFLKRAKAENILTDPKKFIEEKKNLIYKKENIKSFQNIYAEKNDKHSFFDLTAFKVKPDNDIVNKPDLFEFELLDLNNKFKFVSSNTFKSADDAEEACHKTLSFLTDIKSYLPVPASGNSQKFILQIKSGDQPIANSDEEYPTASHALNETQEIISIVKQHRYFMSIEERPSLWNFKFLIGYDKNDQYFFKSSVDFDQPGIALEAAGEFYSSIDNASLKRESGRITLRVKGGKYSCFFVPEKSFKIDDVLFKRISYLFELKKAVDRAMKAKGTDLQKVVSSLITNDIGNSELKYVYRLVDKDNLHAVYYKTDYADCNEADKAKKELFQNYIPRDFPKICFGEEIIHEIKNPVTKSIRYRYQIKSIRPWFKNAPFVLFESVKSYASKEEAIKAFEENYLLVLQKARYKKYYGENLFISEKEIPVEEDDNCSIIASVVFIPAELTSLFINNAIIIDELIKFATLFPIRLITKESKEEEKEKNFYDRFPCEPRERNTIEKGNCSKKSDPEKYYYFVLCTDSGKEIIETWQSVKYFNAPAEAFRQFHFFLLLLRYPGNYFTQIDYCDCSKKNLRQPCTCKWKIYIREVLAESKDRFPGDLPDTEPCKFISNEAWKAVEKFICVSQTENAFHTYLDKEHCAYSFNVACDNLGLVHPCTYNTIEKRDEAIEKLVVGANELSVWKFPEIKNEEKQCVLYSSDESAFAKIVSFNPKNQSVATSQNACLCIADLIYFGSINGFEKKEEKFIVNISDDESLRISRYNEPMKFDEWEKMFFKLCCEYPIVRKNKDEKYYIEFQLPGFNCCMDDFAEPELCGCGKEKKQDDDCKCCIAWKSECCFKTCEEAISFLTKNKDCLLNYSNYFPVFDCDCGPYGIKLNCSCIESTKPPDDSPQITHDSKSTKNKKRADEAQDDENKNQGCCNEIIAFNPQRYETPKMDCDAVKRAKKLINTEGLHLVEHILLRPRCPEDCVCLIDTCPASQGAQYDPTNNSYSVVQNIDNCCWEWKESGETDPCDEDDPKVCSAPGNDPYSFIATIALPAWSERFNKKENRLLVENLLNREAPAHVLLRILWLSPKDFCKFETYVKKWNHWISKPFSEKCIENPTCEFIVFLFKTLYECLPWCNECIPCQGKIEIQPECFPKEKDPCCDATVLYNINHLYCWTQNDCNKIEKYPAPKMGSSGDSGEVILLKKKIEKKPGKQKEVKTKEKVSISSKAAADFFNTRRGNFKTHVTLELASTKKEQLKKKLISFLDKQKPTTIDFFNSLNEIKKQFTKGKQAAGTSPVKAIKENIICFFLDKIFTGMTVIENETEFTGSFKKELKQVNSKRMLKVWDYQSIIDKGIENNHELIGKLLDGLK